MTAPSSTIETYTWPASAGIIDQIDLRKDSKEIVAYIHARENSSSLHAMRESFRKHGWASSSDEREGKSVLRLTGIRDETELLGLLESVGYTSGEPQVSNKAEAQEQKTGIEKFKSNSLRTSALFFMLGDLLFLTSGIKRGNDIGQMGTGLSFLAGDAALLTFGGKDDRRQFNSLLNKLKKFYDENGIIVPTGSAMNVETLAKPDGLLEKTYDFMHEHINTFKILAEVTGGFFYFLAGLKQQNPRKQAAAAFILAGWGASLMVKEKKIDPEAYAKADPLHRLWMQVQNKPLRLAGYGGLTHNVLSTIGAFEERQKYIDGAPGGTPFYRWDMAGIAAMMTANSLYSISHKTTGGKIDSDALLQDVYGLAAQILAHQPAELREAAIAKTADFLGQRHEIKDTRPQIIEKLHKHIEDLNRNPWFERSYASDPSPVRGR